MPTDPALPSTPPPRVAWAIAAASLTTAALVGFGVFVALPARYWPVDAAAVVIVVLELLAAAGLIRRARWGEAMARASATTLLVLGLFGVSALAVTASWLSGIYGPVGRGGAVVLGLVALLVLPYLVLVPLAQLLWLGPWRGPRAGERERSRSGGAA